MTERWQLWVAKQVLARNRRTGANDPPIIVRDRAAQPPHDWFMAHQVTGPGFRLAHYDGSGVFLLSDGPLEFEGLRPGIDPDATKPDVTD